MRFSESESSLGARYGTYLQPMIIACDQDTTRRLHL